MYVFVFEHPEDNVTVCVKVNCPTGYVCEICVPTKFVWFDDAEASPQLNVWETTLV